MCCSNAAPIRANRFVFFEVCFPHINQGFTRGRVIIGHLELTEQSHANGRFVAHFRLTGGVHSRFAGKGTGFTNERRCCQGQQHRPGTSRTASMLWTNRNFRGRRSRPLSRGCEESGLRASSDEIRRAETRHRLIGTFSQPVECVKGGLWPPFSFSVMAEPTGKSCATMVVRLTALF